MVVTSRAIVLSSRKHGETSKIVTLYTAQFGKLNVIAKGARELRSKFGGALEAFALSDVVFYYKKDTGGLCLISKAETRESNSGILNSLERIELASQIVELVLRALHDEEENPRLFALIQESLAAIGTKPEESLQSLLFYFYLRFIEISGFQFNLAMIEHSRSDAMHLCFKIKTGEIVELRLEESDARYAPIQTDHIPISLESVAILRALEQSTVERAASLRPSARAHANLAEIFNSFFSEHFEGLHKRALRSTGSLTRR